MRSEQSQFTESSGDDDSSELHTEIKSVQFDPRLLPLYEEHHRHLMQLELRKQDDTTRVVLQQIADTTAITKRGQSIAGLIAILALVGGFVLIAIDKDAAGAAVLVMDAVFVFSQKFIGASQPDHESDRADSQ